MLDKVALALAGRSSSVSADSEELLQHILVQSATWLLGRVVRHEVNDEVVRSWRNQSGEGAREVVWVVVDRVVGDKLRLLSNLVQIKVVIVSHEAHEVVP